MYKNYILRLKRAVHNFIKELKTDPDKKVYAGDKYYCPVCNTGLEYFKPIDYSYLELIDKYEYDYPIAALETFNFIKYSCPNCGVSDRDRLYAMYFQKKTINVNKNKKLDFIDFAPSGSLSDFFKKFGFLNYRTADLYMECVDDKVDITEMKIYKDSSFDIFLCSHVLEHVNDDSAAMKELYRILRPGGWGMAMVPIYIKGEKVIENLPIVTEAERWKYYGQGDHLRFYNRAGFVERLQEAGFKVNLYGTDYFGADVFEKNGIHSRSVLYIVEKL